MTIDALLRNRPIVCDGAMGTMLYPLGASVDDCRMAVEAAQGCF